MASRLRPGEPGARAGRESSFAGPDRPHGWRGGGRNRVRRSRMESRLLAKGRFRNLHPPTPASLRDGTLGAWENSPALARRWNSSIASWVRYCRPAMLTVFSQPFLRHRRVVHVVTPTCSSHRERLTTAAPGIGCVSLFDSIFTRRNLPRARRALVYHKHGLPAAMSRFQHGSMDTGSPTLAETLHDSGNG